MFLFYPSVMPIYSKAIENIRIKLLKLAQVFVNHGLFYKQTKKTLGLGAESMDKAEGQHYVSVWWWCLSLDTGDAHVTLSRRRSCVSGMTGSHAQVTDVLTRVTVSASLSYR